MVPLGPFGSKNFATSISPWIVPLLALEPFRCSPADGPTQHDPAPLPYLRDPDHGSSAFDISLTASVQGAGMPAPETVARSNHRNLYWNIRQQVPAQPARRRHAPATPPAANPRANPWSHLSPTARSPRRHRLRHAPGLRRPASPALPPVPPALAPRAGC